MADRVARGSGGARRRIGVGGFAVVELVAAMGILLLSILGALHAQLSSIRLLRITRETRVAASDLRAAMEEILLLPVTSIPVAGTPFPPGEPIARYTNLHLRDQVIVPEYPGYAVGDPVPDPLTIALTATWTDSDRHPRSLRVSTLRTR